MMGEPIQQGPREAFGAEGFCPFFERQIAGDQPRQIAHMIHAFGGADASLLVMLMQEG